MVFSTLRPLLLLVAGAVAGSLITFGLLNRQAPVQENLVQSGIPPRMLKATATPRQEEGDLDSAASRTVSGEASDSEETPDPKVIAAFKGAEQRIPVRPVATPKVVFQANGLPVGVTPDAGKSEAYTKLPGVQPPLINRDGRDMGREAIQMLETPREEVPFPGGIPSASASPLPFPQTAEEANRQAQHNASPSPAP
jgi:hypothetical protein